MPCGKTAENSGHDDAGERMDRKIEEETEGREEEKNIGYDNHFLTTTIFLMTIIFFNDNRDNGDNRRKTLFMSRSDITTETTEVTVWLLGVVSFVFVVSVAFVVSVVCVVSVVFQNINCCRPKSI